MHVHPAIFHVIKTKKTTTYHGYAFSEATYIFPNKNEYSSYTRVNEENSLTKAIAIN